MSERARRPLTVIIAAALVGALLAGGLEARAAPTSVGSPGLGDPFFPRAGNGGYDVRHYRIGLSYTPSSHHLEASVVVTAVAKKDLRRFDLDFRRLRISKLTVDGDAAAFTRHGQELVITPSSPIAAGKTFEVAVAYAGKPRHVTDPDQSIEGWVPTKDGAFVADEPQGSPSWFPCNDYPTDKATYLFQVTVPKGLSAVANGGLVSKRNHGGKTTFTWRESRPMSTYLATVTTGRFDVSRSKTSTGIPVYDAVDPTQAAKANPVLAKLPRIVDFFSSRFGRYPFGTVGAIVDNAPAVGYALETQTKPLFDRAPDETTLAHELSHQWFGDEVTPTSWPNIWLNEGFATWSEWFWSGHSGGPKARQIFKKYYAIKASNKEFWNPPPRRVHTPVNLFDGTIYARGAMTLQALREKVGNGVFLRILRHWVAQHRYGNASTKQFIALAHKESGVKLRHFFDVWLYERGKPKSW